MILALENSPTIDILTSRSEKIHASWPVLHCCGTNPVVETCKFAYKATDLVQVHDDGVKKAAKIIRQKMLVESYSPRTWRAHPLHICPPEPYNSESLWNNFILDWIFLISSLNFSFWSERESQPDRYGVEWRADWFSNKRKVHTGYWSLVAALNRALEENIPITDPGFYSSEILCPDSLIMNIFRQANQSSEPIPLLRERIAIMRENGHILCHSYGGSFGGFLRQFHRRFHKEGTSLDLVKMVTEAFPSFRDEINYNGRMVYIWKRAQILVAEMWAAFYPPTQTTPHPIFPGTKGPSIHLLSMFADYRVPQILHHLGILTYPPSLLDTLRAGTPLAPGSREELSLRSASIVSVERLRDEILLLIKEENGDYDLAVNSGVVSSVLLDFYLWDLAKRVESGEESVEGLDVPELVPIHRTRSLWY